MRINDLPAAERGERGAKERTDFTQLQFWLADKQRVADINSFDIAFLADQFLDFLEMLLKS